MTRPTHRVRSSLTIGIGLAVLALAAASCGDDEDSGGETTTTTVAPGGTGIVWPNVGDSVTYDDPIAAVTRFAIDFVGFTDPIVTNFRPGEPAMVEVRPTSDGPVTTVFLQQEQSSWVVSGAATGDIAPTAPAPRDVVASPLQLLGTSSAFEGAVGVRVRDRGAVDPLAESYVTGGSTEMGPFEGTVDFSPPTTADGSVMFYANSMEDGGGVWAATVVGVEFAP